MKAFLYDRGYTSILTHSLKELVRECSRWVPTLETLSREAKILDMVYVTARYPNGLAGDVAPTEFYEKEDAEKCISSAESILNAVKSIYKR